MPYVNETEFGIPDPRASERPPEPAAAPAAKLRELARTWPDPAGRLALMHAARILEGRQ